MSFAEIMARTALGAKMPEFNPSYCWVVAWLFEDENCAPHEETHSKPENALNQMVSLWNTPRTLVHISVSRRNA